MKSSIKLSIFTAIILLFVSNSFSTPLSGTYTIGSGGTYPTINSAVSDLNSLGVNGNVVFEILSGIYDEHFSINSILGSSLSNTVTFKSQTGNPNDVRIGFFTNPWPLYYPILQIDGVSNLIIRDVTFEQNIDQGKTIYLINLCSNIKIINNIFKDYVSKFVGIDISNDNIFPNTILNDILIKDNIFDSEFNNVTLGNNFNLATNINIIGNTFPGTLLWYGKSAIEVRNCNSLLIEKNIIDGEVRLYSCKFFNLSKNKLYKNYLFGGVYISGCCTSLSQSIISNNFCSIGGQYYSAINFKFSNSINLLYINNSIQRSADVFGSDFIIESSTDISFLNNFFDTDSRAINIDINSSLSTSDYNDFYNGGNPDLINYHGVSYNNVSDFYTATGLDQHSNSRSVTFQSSTDLHLAGSSIGDMQLAGIPNVLVPDDIDGQTRSLIHPYKGADEADFPLPVELTSFTSSVTNNNVLLNWTTASEFNNSGFEVERSLVNSEWSRVNFIKGHGNLNTPENYSYEDKNLTSGKYKYRLKQLDFNGNFEYYNLSNEVEIGVPDKFSLSQNYPNPFNPSTTINYELPATNFVTLKIYDLVGKEVMTIVNEKLDAGRYSATFNGADLSSGMYFYKITAGEFTFVKKMILIK